MRLATVAQSREADRLAIEEIGIDGRVLMENAGRGAAIEIDRRLPARPARVAVLCGGGNNGGDGFVIARHLRIAGHHVKALLLSDPEKLSKDCATNCGIARKMAALDALPPHEAVKWTTGGPSIEVLDVPDEAAFGRATVLLFGAHCIVDAMLGTGLRSDVSGLFATAIDATNERSEGRLIFAVDVPSGLDGDTGAPHGRAVRAHATATFGVPKIGLYAHPGRECAGEVVPVGIGMPGELLDRAGGPIYDLMDDSAARGLVPARSGNFHKGDAGHLLVVAGSRDKPGAAILACRAAVRAGAGLCTLGAPREVIDNLTASMFEVMGHPLAVGDEVLSADASVIGAALEGKNAVAIGPGIPKGSGTTAFILHVLRSFRGTVVLDADALNLVAAVAEEVCAAPASKIMTPHPGEMARLLGSSTREVQADRLRAVTECAKKFGAVVVLKGAATVTADVHGNATINPTGNPGMASGGMGDVLTGVAGAFAAAGMAPYDAARVAAYVHGLAADRAAKATGMTALAASDVTEELGRVFREWGR
jgi:NAD(P)H-hydrate epimerase